MDSFLDTHITIFAPGNRSADPSPAFGAGAVVMFHSGSAQVGRTRGGLNAADATKALVVRWTRT